MSQPLGSVRVVTGSEPSTFCFVHAADLHLDTPFDGVREVAPEVADTLREASLAALDALVDLALGRGAAFLLLAGDIYDGAARGLRAQLRLRDGLARLAEAGIASFVVHGNHDPVTEGWSAIGRWPELVTVFGADEPAVVPVVRDGIELATVQGISYARRTTTENLATRLRRPTSGGLAIGLLHCNVAEAGSGHGDYSPCTLEDLRRTGLDYLALGHVHQRTVLARPTAPGEPWVVYPGNTQARSPKPSERGAKGAYVVHVEHGTVRELEFVPLDRVRFAELACEIGELEDLGDLRDRLEDLARTELAHADGRSLVVRARLHGRGPLHHDLARPGSLEELIQALRDAETTRPPFVWWDLVANESAPELDLEEVRGRGDFSADLLELAEELAGDPAALALLAEQLLEAIPRALATRAREQIGDPALLADALGRARTVALDVLAGELG